MDDVFKWKSLVAYVLAVIFGMVAYRAFTPAKSSTEMDRTQLTFSGDKLTIAATGLPFTGTMVERFKDGSVRSSSMVLNGLLHGPSHGYYTNHSAQVREHFVNGVSHGVRTKWYADGTLQSETTIVHGRVTGKFRRWHENGQLAEEATFLEGQPDGESHAYFPSGYLKAAARYKKGQPVSQESWDDGQHAGRLVAAGN